MTAARQICKQNHSFRNAIRDRSVELDVIDISSTNASSTTSQS